MSKLYALCDTCGETIKTETCSDYLNIKYYIVAENDKHSIKKRIDSRYDFDYCCEGCFNDSMIAMYQVEKE
jgi:hypothetical protein